MKEPNYVNLLRILLRCSRLYKAYRDAKAILVGVLEVRKLLLEKPVDDKRATEIYTQVIKRSKRLVS